jgi:hypothetical protein
MLKIHDIPGFNRFPTYDTKNKIILCHTSRNTRDYLLSLKYRYNGEYTKIPHYIISKGGSVFKLLDDNHYCNFMDSGDVDKKSIIITLENLGWFDKIPLQNNFINWIGDIYKENIYEKKWRDYFLWDLYSDEQITSCVNLCKKLMETNTTIEKKFIGHNTKVDGVDRYSGIVTRSNFSVNYTDLNPAFKFEYFKNEIEK